MERKKLYAILFLIILVAALGIRFYYFNLTKNAPVWWDGAEYLVRAKSFAFGTPITGWAPERELIVPIIFSLIYIIGLGEVSIRLLQLLISVGTIAMTYFLFSTISSKKIALYATFGMAFFWLHIFFTQRILLYLWAPLIFLSVIYFFYKGYIKGNKKYLVAFSILAAIGLMTYFSTGFLLVGIFIYLLITEGFSLIKNKKAWLTLFIFLLALSPYMIYSQMTFGFPIPRLKVGAGAAIGEPGAGASAVFSYLQIFPSRVGWAFTILSVLGIGWFFFKFSSDFGSEGWQTRQNRWLLILLCFLTPLIFYMLYAVVGGQGVVYDAFILSIFPFMFAFAGLALWKIEKIPLYYHLFFLSP